METSVEEVGWGEAIGQGRGLAREARWPSQLGKMG